MPIVQADQINYAALSQQDSWCQLVPARPAANRDAYFSSVPLLHHFDGNNVPVVGAAFTGSPAFTSANALFGQSYDNTAGTTTGQPTSSSATYCIGGGDYTAEVWARLTTAPPGSSATVFVLRGTDTATQIQIAADSGSGAWVCIVSDSPVSSVVVSNSAAWALGVWTHLALVRSGNSHQFFVNGVGQGSVSNSYRPTPGSTSILVGNVVSGFPFPFVGLLDDLRLTSGFARYTANFTPPPGPFPNF